MIEAIAVTLILCATALLAQAQHYKNKRKADTASSIESLSKIMSEDLDHMRKELKDLKSNMSALNMKVGFNK